MKLMNSFLVTAQYLSVTPKNEAFSKALISFYSRTYRTVLKICIEILEISNGTELILAHSWLLQRCNVERQENIC